MSVPDGVHKPVLHTKFDIYCFYLHTNLPQYMWFDSICSCIVKSGTFSALKRCSIRLDTFGVKGFQVLYMLIVFIYAYWCPTQFPYQIMFVSFNNTMTGVTCGAGTANPAGAHECTAGYWRGSCCSIFSFMRCGSLFFLLLFFFWPLYCLLCFDLRRLITILYLWKWN
jgi:hypothetical protein